MDGDAIKTALTCKTSPTEGAISVPPVGVARGIPAPKPPPGIGLPLALFSMPQFHLWNEGRGCDDVKERHDIGCEMQIVRQNLACGLGLR